MSVLDYALYLLYKGRLVRDSFPPVLLEEPTIPRLLHRKATQLTLQLQLFVRSQSEETRLLHQAFTHLVVGSHC